MARRPTIPDVAREAGVSTATVDRVLNGRSNVREDTARRVADAAQRIGYHAANLIEQRLRADLPEIRFGCVLHKERQVFYQTFAQEIEKAVEARSDIRGKALIRFSPTQTAEGFAQLMRDLSGRVDVMASSAINHYEVTEVVTDLLKDRVPTFALLSDFAQGVRRTYVGLNNLKVGRIAGWMLATATKTPGKLAVFTGGHRWHGHELRETGLRSFFREFAPDFKILDTLVNLETRRLTYEVTLDLLARHPDLRGIYVAGGGMEGAIAALREARSPGEVALVVNELVPESRSALLDGYVTMVIATPLDILCRKLIDLMVASVRSAPGEIVGEYFLEPQLYLPESV